MVVPLQKSKSIDSKTFHKLIRMQRSNSNINTDILILDDTKYTGNDKNIPGNYRGIVVTKGPTI